MGVGQPAGSGASRRTKAVWEKRQQLPEALASATTRTSMMNASANRTMLAWLMEAKSLRSRVMLGSRGAARA